MNIIKRAGALALSAAMALCLGLTAVPTTAQASYDSFGDGDIDVHIHYKPNWPTEALFNSDTAANGVQRQGYRLYRIASISKDGRTFDPDPAYENLVGTSIFTTMTPYNAYQRVDWDLVSRVGTYINETSPEPSYAAAIVDGEADFENLPEGLYLGTGPASEYGSTTYTPVPFVICLPYLIADAKDIPAGSDLKAGVEYTDVGITLKFDEYTPSGGGGRRHNPTPTPTPPTDNPPPDTPPDNPPPDNPPDNPPPGIDIPDEPVPLVDIPDEPTPLVDIPDEPTPNSPATPPKTTTTTTTPNKPKLPQTGALWWPVPVMGGSGAVLMCAGLVGRRKSK